MVEIGCGVLCLEKIAPTVKKWAMCRRNESRQREGESTLQRETTFVQSGGRERDNVDLKQQKTENKNHENDKLTKVEGTT